MQRSLHRCLMLLVRRHQTGMKVCAIIRVRNLGLVCITITSFEICMVRRGPHVQDASNSAGSTRTICFLSNFAVQFCSPILQPNFAVQFHSLNLLHFVGILR